MTVKSFPRKKSTDSMALLVNSIKHLKKKQHQTFSKCSKRVEGKAGTPPNLICEANLALITKPEAAKGEKAADQHLISIQVTQVLNKILSNSIQQFIKRVIHHD
jgi:hypothetical protein